MRSGMRVSVKSFPKQLKFKKFKKKSSTAFRSRSGFTTSWWFAIYRGWFKVQLFTNIS
ncbi:unnamed protein product [Nezara viridula]|uniref:Uncharacterized protein n=1 Tax=Nezara viridula TaxID=85310 RepID=A0A9P0HNZ3_NEZVI|nr:unnamed protein product [Nezara viridula]